MEAELNLPARPGRGHGTAYPRELYEAVVGEVLSEARLSATLMTRVVGEVAPSRTGPDRVALARVARQREAATAKYLRDRDVAAIEATMSRLDAEEREACQEHVVDGAPPAEAARYLRELQPTWEAADSGTGRQILAQALPERIEVRGFRVVALHLSDAALAHGFGAVLPENPRAPWHTLAAALQATRTPAHRHHCRAAKKRRLGVLFPGYVKSTRRAKSSVPRF